MSTTCVGIDPGKTGALAAFRDGEPVEWTPMPLAGKEVDWHAVTAWLRDLGEVKLVALEKVHSMPKQGVSSTFKFGINYGGLQAVLAALEIPCQLVTPQAWKKRVLAGTEKDKAAAIAHCRRRWPSVSLLATERCRTPHDGIADALCIAQLAWEMSR